MSKFSESFCCQVNLYYVNKLLCIDSAKMPLLIDSGQKNGKYRSVYAAIILFQMFRVQIFNSKFNSRI